MKRLPILLTLLAALVCALLALMDPASAQGGPGGPQHQTPPDPCLVCGPWTWPEPGWGPNNQPGPQCIPGEPHTITESCTCPAPNGATIGGTRDIRYVCNEAGFWVHLQTMQCRTAGTPGYCS